MTKNIFVWIVIVVVGALLGSFIGGFIGHLFPDGIVHELFAKEISAGLKPTQLDLHVLELTFGCVLNFNVTSVLGIFLAGFLFRSFK